MQYRINKEKFLSRSELAELETIIDFESIHKSRMGRDKLIIRLALETGARAQEILNIKCKDLNHDTKSVLIHGIKNSHDREIPLHNETYETMSRFCRALSDESRIFGINYRRLEQVWSHYRPVKKKFHSLRHTFAVELYKKTKDIKLVQLALGHKDIKNTMVYVDFVYSQEELRKLIL